ncbi:OmpP1/FadL family transporter [Pseudothauera rhizosphaerae]|uniref:Transporter n=1 Tax=Pseudothauera rhizosphaerae TaxID=2565932 RepID=A0A4V3WAQ9_9RHOO|nr:OmpP1/FadL family transporter [Pseudothauera rhizosphaerae]THF60240.1 transporter [Pseudothauera rhizosphaerae]
MKLRKLAVWVPLVVGGAFASGQAMAAGFALQNQNGAGTGNAFAGAAAAAEDASTVFFNPAGMLLLPQGHNLTVGLTVIDRQVDFSDRGTAAVPTFALGRDGGDGGGAAVVPVGYWSYSISPTLAVGIGVGPTFGNKTEFDKDFVGRFSGYFAEIKQINVNPSIAYRVNETVSLGFGINVAKNETEFRQMAILGAGTEREAHLKGDDVGIGWNAGALFQIDPATRIGLTYRSKIKFDLEGKQTIPGVLNAKIEAELETPDTASLALHRQVNERWELLADLTWTGWSSIEEIRVEGGTAPVLDYNFKDTWRVGLGAGYRVNDKWKLRFGVAWDEAPVRSAADRTMTLPDSDRTWLAVGARYTLNRNASVDLGYAHIFFKDAPTERVAAIPTALGGTQTIHGKFEVSADLFSVQYNHNF